MIKVSYDHSLFNDLMWSLDKYCDFLHVFYNKEIHNPFLKDADGIPVLPYTDVEAIKNSNSDILIIDLMTEGFQVSSYFGSYPKDKSYILCSNGTWDSTIDFGFEYYLLHWNYNLYSCIHKMVDYRTVDYFQNKQYKFYCEKPLLFSCLIGTTKPARDTFVKKLISNVKNKNYILNYSGKEFGQPSRDIDVNYDYDNFLALRPIKTNYCIAFTIPIEMFNRAKINLVVETNTYDFKEVHLTEKTMKPLMLGCPFVVLSSYKFLEYLKNLGFKTYGEFWSEEYDNIQNLDDRIDAIIEVINYIDQIEWSTDLIKKFEDIANYNRQVLLNVNDIMKPQLDKIIHDVSQFNI